MGIEKALNHSRLSLSEAKIYDGLKTSGPDGSTSIWALLKFITPNSHTIDKTLIGTVYAHVHRINRKIEPRKEKIVSIGKKKNKGYSLIDL